ncbi:hypothetical protein [Mucilaginibacter sp.]|uniref:hypothetical protein n=1 Tax=Mucilaginibacter sp. TaxID=1882438 RepID=UPI003D0E839E
MACTSVLAYTKQCSRGISGGVAKLWVIGYGDLVTISGSTEVYAMASGTTIVNQVNIASGKTFVSVGLLKESVSYKGTIKRDSSTGAFENSQETTIVISSITEVAKQFVDSLMQQPVALLIKLRSGVYIVSGLNGFCELTNVTEETGTKNSDMNGYQLKLSGVEEGFTKTIDPTYIASIVDKI